jgi:hypothetical protein
MLFKDYRRLSVSVFRTGIAGTGPLKMDTGKIFKIRRGQKLTNTSRHNPFKDGVNETSRKACHRPHTKYFFTISENV